MAKYHSEVVSALWAATADFQKYNCLFNQALRKMTTFLEHFATRAAPYSGSSEDHEFKILMDNFGAVIDTISIFYERFDCEGRAEILRAERDGGRMHLFGFEKNDPGRPLGFKASSIIYTAQYPGEFLLGTDHKARESSHEKQSCGCDMGSTFEHIVLGNSPADSGVAEVIYAEMPSRMRELDFSLSSPDDLPMNSFVEDNWPDLNSPRRLNYDCWLAD